MLTKTCQCLQHLPEQRKVEGKGKLFSLVCLALMKLHKWEEAYTVKTEQHGTEHRRRVGSPAVYIYGAYPSLSPKGCVLR